MDQQTLLRWTAVGGIWLGAGVLVGLGVVEVWERLRGRARALKQLAKWEAELQRLEESRSLPWHSATTTEAIERKVELRWEVEKLREKLGK